MSELIRRSSFARTRFIACGLALATAWVIASPTNVRAADAPNPDPARFESEIAAFEAYDRQNSFPRDAVLFVGSSSIRMWPTAESFPDLAVINRGFGGSHASDVVHFANRIVLKYAPRTIVFYAGDNDTAGGKPPAQIAVDFRKFAALVHAKLPQTRIIFLPIKPSLARWKMWPEMQAANALVKDFAATDPRITVVDTATPLLGPDGEPQRDLYLDDGLHLNAAGYAVWTALLRDRIAMP
jgi:lysophospholipase L1-like esterase